MKKNRVSQVQIARDLNLSQTLVSMVLNGRRSGISAESYEKIWSHARKIGYRPRGMDPAIMEQDSAKTVGFLLRSGLKLHTQSNFFSHVQNGLHEYLSSQGMSLLFLGSEEHLKSRQLKDSYRSSHSLRGLIILGQVKLPFLMALKQIEPRLVTVSAQYSGLCHSVLSNEQQAAEQLIQHLMSLGHREFAWIGGNRGSQRIQQRYQAVVSALRIRNITLQDHYQIELDGADRMEGRMAAEQLLKVSNKRQRPTAWICHNGLMARGAANFLIQRGLDIPRDVSLAAFDRTRVCQEDHPTLTGAGAEPEKMGQVAGELLLRCTGEPNEMFSDVVLASELIARESTGPAPSR